MEVMDFANRIRITLREAEARAADFDKLTDRELPELGAAHPIDRRRPTAPVGRIDLAAARHAVARLAQPGEELDAFADRAAGTGRR